MTAGLGTDTEARLQATKAAARTLRALASGTKQAVLEAAARLLRERRTQVLAANAQDLEALKAATGITAAFRDRLTLTDARLNEMEEGLRQVAGLPDPVGELVEERRLANGLRVRRVRSPLGVIFMIFESRPNVATEAFSLAFRAGNACILRGGKESMRTTAVLYAVLHEALAKHGVPEAAVWGIEDADRALVDALLLRKDAIDIVVPRGGEALIEHVTSQSRIPLIKNDRGMCHVYVHEDADPAMASAIAVNAKTQRPGVCNAMETVLVHARVAAGLLPGLWEKMGAVHAMSWHGCPETLRILGERPGLMAARAADWDTEYLDYALNCRVVQSFEAALAHIERHGSRHSEAIVTRDAAVARRFEAEVDAAVTYWNASTRFTDGFELGLGGELGVSTQKLHVRGPVGLRELTSVRWIIEGDGQTKK